MTSYGLGPAGLIQATGSIQSRVHHTVRTLITSGELSAGEAISEISLAERFGVSRTPVREALKQLKTEGLVEIRAQIGTFVSSPTSTQVTELSVVRGALESLAAGLMAERGANEEIKLLWQNIANSQVAVELQQTERYAGYVAEFHRIILEGCGNGALRYHHQILVNQLAYASLVRASLGRPGRPRDSFNEHKHIVEAIASGDRVRSEAAMRVHVEHSHFETLQALAEVSSRESVKGHELRPLANPGKMKD